MAPRRAKKQRAAETGKEGVVSLTIVMDMTDDVPSYYVNHAEISHTKHDFAISAARLPAKPSPARIEQAKQSGEFHIEPILQIVLPPTMIPGLIQALMSQKEAYEKANGEIRDSSHWAKEEQ